ncbi:MAG TPA: FAD-binding oxidoreductase [Steroidobacteraceae bacterium]|nr:FAD-binding oxidoreductase [Steroidobacteraceae bacterium]
MVAKVGRRRFVQSTLAAAGGLWVPGRGLWAQPASPRAIPASLPAISGAGKPLTLSAADLRDLRAGLKGRLLLPRDAGYDEARRYWDSAFDRRPGLIVLAADADDVVKAVQFARSHELLTAVKAGGHCQIEKATACDGGMMIDLSPMRQVQIDVPGSRVRAQGGVLLGDIDRKSQAVGLATTLGTATDTGIAGLTLGGGIGRLMRTFGLAIDNVVSAQIVTADGKLRHLSAQDNPDLFWAIRGGGGNFGVVTAFEYRLHPLAHPVLAANGSYPYERTQEVLRAVRDLAAGMPDEMTLGAELSNDERGRQVTWSGFYSGDPKQGERLLAPLRKLGKTLRERMSAESYLAAQGVPTNAPLAVPQAPASYERHGYVYGEPTDALFDELARRFATVPATMECFASLGQFGGAVARVRPEATAYWNRAASFGLLLGDSWQGRLQPEAIQKAYREVWSGLEPLTRGYYINGDSEVLESRLRATYGENYPRLVRVKNQYDPTNLFRLNANIKPAPDPRMTRG